MSGVEDNVWRVSCWDQFLVSLPRTSGNNLLRCLQVIDLIDEVLDPS